MQLCCNHDAHNAAPRFSGGKKKKKKQKQEGKNTEGGFHFTPDEQTEPSRGLFVSIPWHVPF